MGDLMQSLWPWIDVSRGPLSIADMRSIVSNAAAKFETSVAEIMGPSRARRIVYARSVAIQRMHETGRISYSRIAQFLGKDHKTVMASAKRYVPEFAFVGEFSPTIEISGD